MSRRNTRSLIAVAAVAALLFVAGCSLLGGPTQAPAPPSPVASGGTQGATSTPAVSQSSSGTAVPVPGLPQLTSVSSDVDGIELRDLRARGALVVDLQSAADFEKEHIEGAVNVPMPDFTRTAWGWPRDRVVVLYDRTGAQGQAAQSWLERNKFTKVYHLFRGIEGYDDTLVGDDPTPIPPREPVLYYFYINPANLKPGQLFSYDSKVLDAADEFIDTIKSEFDGEFEFHSYDVTQLDGQVRFLEFGGTSVPMFRLVTEDGQSEQFTGIGTIETVRSHLKKAIEGYRADRK